MPHIDREPGGYDNTASAYIFRVDGEEPRLLLHLHKKLGKYMQVGGHQEPKTNIWKSCTDEILEESGYDPDQLQVLQPPYRIHRLTDPKTKTILHPYPIVDATHRFEDTGDPELVDHHHSDRGYALVTTEDPRHPIGEGESQDIRWVTHAELDAMTSAETFDNVRDIANFIFEVALEHWERVPATDFAIA